MRNRLVGAVAATAIAAAALVACSPPNENPSDIKVTDQENPTHSFEKSGAESSEATTSEQGPAVQ
ncbi:hypothetical protein [Corynebacterium freneyi]|uniref:Secreted protein n=1 Tax=Corynebacterium freneyi DNF00450 TaxID=1287475 RepID=A0A095ZCH2_9CORY|nr:hypothetical protein [Corynebacterium freneyi]KGF16377.1 hypothetical protein HMPREF1650_07780 [Corynebacterium freneyi DNF00450]